MLRIRTLAPGFESWKKKVDVFVRTAGPGSVVGVEREI